MNIDSITRRALSALAIVVVAAVSSCSEAQSGPPSLYVTVDLPAGADQVDASHAWVTVSGPDGESVELAVSHLFEELEPGDYVVTARDVEIGGRHYVALPPSTSVSLIDGMKTTVPVTFVETVEYRQIYAPAAVQLRSGSFTYHLDCEDGNDGFSGLSPDQAVRTLERANQLSLRPGDRLLLKRECAWQGPLNIRWNGTQEWPVTIGAYGEGTPPIVRDSRQNNVDVYGSYIVVEHVWGATEPFSLPLDAECGDQPVAWRSGFTVQHEAHNVTLRYVIASGNTAGVHLTRGAQRVHLLHSQLIDNVVMSVNSNDGGFDDSGAWGLLINGSDNVIAYNTFSGNNAWCSYDFGQEGASIEIYEGVNNLIHHNVSIDDTTFSEIGSSSRRAARDNVFAYNVYASSLPVSQFMVIRGDDAHFGPTHGTGLYHNTVHLTHPDETQGVVCYAGCGPELLDARNNVIWVEWKALYADAPFTESHNIFWNSRGRPLLQFLNDVSSTSPTSLIADPGFLDADARDYRLGLGSPAAGAGTELELEFEIDIELDFRFDAIGVEIPREGPVYIGAFHGSYDIELLRFLGNW